MRWKLLLIVSLIAGLVGSGATIAIIIFLLGSTRRLEPGSVDIIAFAPLIIPIAMIIVASIFVYRHTARRRKLQAMMTALLSALLMLTIFFISQMLLTRRNPEPPPPQPGKITSNMSSIRESRACSQAPLLFQTVEADLLLQRAQSIDHEAHVLLRLDA
jgi:hypothetical protein